MTSFYQAGLIFLLAGCVQGLTGFGAGLVAIPLLCLIIDVKIAVPLCILNGLIITSYLAVKLRSYLDKTKIFPLLIGSIPGVLIGAMLLKHIYPNHIRTLLGILLISYSGYNLLAKPKPIRPLVIWGYIAGFFTGGITALLSAGGPPAIIYTTLTDWKKEEMKATLTGFFVFNAIFTAVVHALNGMTTGITLQYFVATAPFVLLGTVLGSKLSERINRTLYLQIVYSFLIVMGLMMLLGP